MAFPPPVKITEVKNTQLFINNEFVNSASGKTFPSINPTTEQKICDVQEGDKADVDKAVAAARAAQKGWAAMGPTARGKLINKLADLIDRDLVYIASLESHDNGKPYTNCIAMDIPASSNNLRFFAGWGDKLTGRTIAADGPLHVYTRREPLGVCGLILPWNFPLMILTGKVAAALTCGNTCVVKPPEQTPLTALYFATLVKEAGFPPGVINIVTGYGPTAGAAITNHMDVNMVSFTGSTEVGQIIMKAAANTNLKRVTLELGGKSPLIIMPDADLDDAAKAAHMGIFTNMGQVCVASSRLFVHEDIYDKMVTKLVEMAKKRKIGDPSDLTSESGPQVDKEQFEKIMSLIELGKKDAKLECGGSRHGTSGYYVENTIFTDVKNDSRIAKEEIFGPVQCIIKFKTTEEVLRMANDTTYGLAAGVFTKDIDSYIKIANGLEAGTVWVNCWFAGAKNAPFGGYKMSGIGREGGEYGLEFYTEIKTIVVKANEPKL